MNRRDFLDPRHLANAAGQLLAAVDELQAPEPAASDEEIALLRATHPAMATTFEVQFLYGTPQALTLATQVFDQIDQLEQQLTVYRDTSEVSRLNRLAAQLAVPVEERLFELLRLAAQLTEETDGAYDITAGALIKAWGFYRGPRQVPAESERSAALGRVGMRHVVLDAKNHTVRYLRPGLEMNLGSIGKGYALDRAAEGLRERNPGMTALLHGGHSSIFALGTGLTPGRGWPVGICDPSQPERRLALVWLRDQALGTSAATLQHFEYNGRKLGHLLDPRTGWPAEGMALASVIAPTAALADALSTAFYVGGVELARRYCAAHPEVGALLLPAGDDRQPVLLGVASSEILVVER